MKLTFRILITFFLILNFSSTYSQTPLRGLIDSKVILSKADSPFLVDSHLVVSTRGSLVIDPGVELQFGNNVELLVLGKLQAVGSELDSITFTLYENAGSYQWSGITIEMPGYKKINFDYCNFKNASTAIKIVRDSYGISISHSSFINNNRAINVSGSEENTTVDDCYFFGNGYGISGRDFNIENCIFDNNNYGLSKINNSDVSYCEFKNHSEIAVAEFNGKLSNCKIEFNKVGIKLNLARYYSSRVILVFNTITNNELGAEIINDYDNSQYYISSNNICNNNLYNIYYQSDFNIDLSGNCMCSTDSAYIENLIFDGYDDPGKGLVSYEIFDENCDEVIASVIKKIINVEPDTTEFWTIDNSPYVISDDYEIPLNHTLIIEPGVEVKCEKDVKFTINGKLIANGTINDSIIFTSVSDSIYWDGIYLGDKFSSFEYCTFQKAKQAIIGSGKTKLSAFKHLCFIQNKTAIDGNFSNLDVIDSCYFFANDYAIKGTSVDEISDCDFEKNSYGVYSSSAYIINCSFIGHGKVAIYRSRGRILNCSFKKNTIAIDYFKPILVMYCDISHNKIGVDLNGKEGVDFRHNQICDNLLYNIKNNTLYAADFSGNCWCTEDSLSIEEKIYDGFDNRWIGYINYEIYNENCNNVIAETNKLIPKTEYWTKENSPYELTEDFVVPMYYTLIIEPGVEVFFNDSVKLEVRGNLYATGTESDSILFTSVSDTVKWLGFVIQNNLGAKVNFDYCNFSNAYSAIHEQSFGDLVSVQHSVFTHNYIAIEGGSKSEDLERNQVTNCYFANNTYGLFESGKYVSKCIFENNDYGLYHSRGAEISNSTFTNHSQSAINGENGLIVSCIIENNNIGVSSFEPGCGLPDGFSVVNSIVSNNNIGIDLGGNGVVISRNEICNNSVYNIRNNSNNYFQVFNNCWCTSDSTLVEDKIFDGVDNYEYGYIDYVLYLDDCESKKMQTNKKLNLVTYFDVTAVDVVNQIEPKIYPNPTSREIRVENIFEFDYITIYNYLGQAVFAQTLENENEIEVDLSALNRGFYFVELKNEKQKTTTKLIKR